MPHIGLCRCGTATYIRAQRDAHDLLDLRRSQWPTPLSSSLCFALRTLSPCQGQGFRARWANEIVKRKLIVLVIHEQDIWTSSINEVMTAFGRYHSSFHEAKQTAQTARRSSQRHTSNYLVKGRSFTRLSSSDWDHSSSIPPNSEYSHMTYSESEEYPKVSPKKIILADDATLLYYQNQACLNIDWMSMPVSRRMSRLNEWDIWPRSCHGCQTEEQRVFVFWMSQCAGRWLKAQSNN